MGGSGICQSKKTLQKAGNERKLLDREAPVVVEAVVDPVEVRVPGITVVVDVREVAVAVRIHPLGNVSNTTHATIR